MQEEIALVKKLDALRSRHQQLDNNIDTLSASHQIDQLQLMRLKKERLVLRDQIIHLEEILYPDIIA